MTNHPPLQSLDPRVNRTVQAEPNLEHQPAPMLDQWPTYEVFHQAQRGLQHVHVGIVHAPSSELALLFAKEQFARRMKCANLWVVRTQDVAASEYDDEDMFQPGFDKSYREASFYRNRERIDEFLRGADKIVMGGAKKYINDLRQFEDPESPKNLEKGLDINDLANVDTTAQAGPAAAAPTKTYTVVGAPMLNQPIKQSNITVNPA